MTGGRVTTREQRLVFGEVARSYDDVRAGYPAEIGERIFAYTEDQVPVVEIGAGTGKATAMLVAAGAAVTCVEPDPAMAGLLRARFRASSGGRVDVHLCGFEEWPPPPGGVPLICSAQAFHWVDAATRWRRVHDALAPGGTLALFGHEYGFADSGLEDQINIVYERMAPELRDDPSQRPATPEENWFHTEMVGSGLFEDVTSVRVESVVPYPTGRYLALLATFSNHRMLPTERRARLHDGIGAVVDRAGGVVEVHLKTLLTMGRRARRRTNVGPGC
jgi:SAM-dependent methyltransferase